MKKKHPSNDKDRVFKIFPIIREIFSLLFSLVAIIVSLRSFYLPLLRTRLVIENPTQIYTLKNNDNFDELIIPVVVNNYGSYIRSINDIECILEYKGFEIPMRPMYVYENVNLLARDSDKKLYSSFIIEPNSGNVKCIGFVFNDTDFNRKDKIPESFHFDSESFYTFHARFYTTRNSFKNNDREIIQMFYGFETGRLNEKDYVFNPSKRCWLEKTDAHIFAAYK